MKAKIGLILRLGISVGLIAVLLWTMRGHVPHIRTTLAETNRALFIFAVLCFTFNVFALSLRLKLLFTGEGLDIAFGRVVQLSFIGFFFNNFMPTAVGGDIVKAYYAHKQTKQTAKSFMAVFMDRFIGLFSFVCIALFALILSWENIAGPLKKSVLIFGISGFAVFLVILNDRIAKVVFKTLSKFKPWNIGQKISRVYRAVHEYRNKKALILAAIGVSIVTQSIYFSTIYLLARSVGGGMLLKTVFVVMPIVSVVSMMPSLGGLGLREGAIVVTFGPFMGAEGAFSLSILLLATLLITSLVGGVIYLTAVQFKIKKADISALNKYSV